MHPFYSMSSEKVFRASLSQASNNVLDGRSLRKMCRTFGVRAEFSREPFGLLVTGVRDALPEVEEYIAEIKQVRGIRSIKSSSMFNVTA